MERLTQATNGVLTYVGPGCQHTNTGDIAAEVDTGGVRLILNRLAAYEDTGLTPERVAELAQAERAVRLVVLPDGDDTATLAATIESTDMLRVWCGGTGDLLLGLLSVLAGEVAKKAGTTYRTLLITMAKREPIGDGFKEKRTEEERP